MKLPEWVLRKIEAQLNSNIYGRITLHVQDGDVNKIEVTTFDERPSQSRPVPFQKGMLGR